MASPCGPIYRRLNNTRRLFRNPSQWHAIPILLQLLGVLLALASPWALCGQEWGRPVGGEDGDWLNTLNTRDRDRPAELADPAVQEEWDLSIREWPSESADSVERPRNHALEIVQQRDEYAVRRYRQGFFQRFRFSGGWIDRAGEDDLGISSLETALTVAIPLGSFENLLLVTPAFAVDYLDGPAGVDTPPRLYNTGVDIMWRKQFNDRWGSMLAVRPGVASDLRTSQDAVRITGRAFATWQWVPERLSLLFGVVYLDRNDIPMLPAVGLIWTPTPDWRMDLIFPRPKLARRLTFIPRQREDWAYLGGSIGGRTWAVKRLSGVTDQLTLRDYRLYLGFERIADGGGGLFAEVGYVFGRKLEYEDIPLAQSLNDAVMIRGGIRY